MKKNTSRLLKLVNELLDFRKSEIGGLKLTFVEANISSMVRNFHLRFSQLIEERELEFELELGEKDIHAFVDKEAFKKMIPKEIYERKDKIGFATPEKEWLKELKPVFKEIIDEQKNDEFVDWKGIQENFDSIYNNALKTNTQRIWRLINFAIWKKVYQV